MYKFAVALFALVSVAAAKPGALANAPVAYTAPVVTAASSQFIARNYNGLAAAPLVAAPAPAPLAVAAPAAVAAAPLAYSAPLLHAAPLAYSAYAAPLTYAASPVLLKK